VCSCKQGINSTCKVSCLCRLQFRYQYVVVVIDTSCQMTNALNSTALNVDQF